jgi:hypothetical protein
MTDELDERRIEAVREHLQHFMRAGRTDNVAVVKEAAERLEIEVMVEHLPAAERRLLAAAADFLWYCAEQRGGESRRSVLDMLARALSEED